MRSSGTTWFALREILRRYARVTATAWRERRRGDGDTRDSDEAAFLPAALAIQEKPISPTVRWSIRVLLLLIISLLLWSVFGKIDIVVAAHGKLVPNGHVKTVSALESGTVSRVHVVEGQRVQAGDLLLEMDRRLIDAESSRTSMEILMARLVAARSRALLQAVSKNQHRVFMSEFPGVPAGMVEQERMRADLLLKDHQAKMVRLQEDLRRSQSNEPLARKRFEDMQALAVTGDVSRHAASEKEIAWAEASGQLHSAEAQLRALHAEFNRELAEAEREAEKTVMVGEQELLRQHRRLDMLRVTAPADGRVHQLMISAPGQVVQPAQPLMSIVPANESLIAEIELDTKDVGFLRPGQAAEIKLDAYDYAKYGTIPATLISLSADSVQDEKRGLFYVARIAPEAALDDKGLWRLASSGLGCSVSILTGRRRIIEYVLSPLIRQASEALRER